MKNIILRLGDAFVKIDRDLGNYSAAGIFRTGKTKKSVSQQVKYFEDKCPLKAIKKLENSLNNYKEYNKKLYE